MKPNEIQHDGMNTNCRNFNGLDIKNNELTNCLDCWDCLNCNKCKSCMKCKNCVDCSHCQNLKGCEGCTWLGKYTRTCSTCPTDGKRKGYTNKYNVEATENTKMWACLRCPQRTVTQAIERKSQGFLKLKVQNVKLDEPPFEVQRHLHDIQSAGYFFNNKHLIHTRGFHDRLESERKEKLEAKTSEKLEPKIVSP